MKNYSIVQAILFLLIVNVIADNNYATQNTTQDTNLENLIVKHECQSPERFIYNNCLCPEGFYDDGVNDVCQLCPYPSQYCSLSNLGQFQTCTDRIFQSLQFVLDEKNITQVHDYLMNDLKIYDPSDKLMRQFKAVGKVHGQSFSYARFKNWKKSYKFYEERMYKCNEYFWNKTEMYHTQGRGLSKFIEDLGIFEYTGAFTVITNHPGQQGVRHYDHKFKSVVSEFVWLRFDNNKQFNVEDDDKNKHYVTSNIAFFDDWRIHNIGTIDDYSYSIRVNGKFRPWVRKYIADNFQFDNEDRRKVFIEQEQVLRPYPYKDKDFIKANATLIEEIEKEYKAKQQLFKNDLRGV